MKTNQILADTQLLWLTDLHLDRATESEKFQLFKKLQSQNYQKVVITGDISTAHQLIDHLQQIAETCHPRPVYFVLGNHDYYGSSLTHVNSEVASFCAATPNLVRMNGHHAIRLAQDTCMIGLDGWADARAGYRAATTIDSPDHHRIEDFEMLDRTSAFRKMEQLGRESESLLRATLPYALTCYKHVVIATHVPPYPHAAKYNDRTCGPSHLPHFTNVSAGLVISSIARGFPKTKITILAGHTHSQFHGDVTDNVQIYVGEKSGFYAA